MVCVFQFSDYSFKANSFLIADEESCEAAIIDPSMDRGSYEEILKKNGYHLKYILITHNHFDHVWNYDDLYDSFGVTGLIEQTELDGINDSRSNASFLMGIDFRLKSPLKPLNYSDRYCLGTHEIRCIRTPGHTSGSVSFFCDEKLFCGDLLFCGSIGRTDISGGSLSMLIDSVEKLFQLLPQDTVVFPGHGPETTLKQEALNNPFL